MNNTLIRFRSFARRLGLIKVINFFRFRILRLSLAYEERFGQAMLSNIRPGDVVWDSGANLGFYTQQFLDRVGTHGQVIAFEPAPACFDALTRKFKNIANIQLENAAMGPHEGKARMRLQADPLATTHQILDEGHVGEGLSNDDIVVEVSLFTGDSYWKKNQQTPSMIKIDVEGYEEQVLLGMAVLLKSSDLRSIFCEVHFALLEKRGELMAPNRIQALLQDSGFRTKWVDASHLQAVRE
jgi:FkbM family methyltransferase